MPRDGRRLFQGEGGASESLSKMEQAWLERRPNQVEEDKGTSEKQDIASHSGKATDCEVGGLPMTPSWEG